MIEMINYAKSFIEAIEKNSDEKDDKSKNTITEINDLFKKLLQVH